MGLVSETEEPLPCPNCGRQNHVDACPYPFVVRGRINLRCPLCRWVWEVPESLSVQDRFPGEIVR